MLCVGNSSIHNRSWELENSCGKKDIPPLPRVTKLPRRYGNTFNCFVVVSLKMRILRKTLFRREKRIATFPLTKIPKVFIIYRLSSNVQPFWPCDPFVIFWCIRIYWGWYWPITISIKTKLFNVNYFQIFGWQNSVKFALSSFWTWFY